MAPTAKPASKPAGAGTKDKKLPAVPESKLKEAKRKLTSRSKLLLRKRITKSKVALRKRQNLVRAERYTRTYLKSQRDVIEKAREAKKAGNIYIPAYPKVAFVVRIRGYVVNSSISYSFITVQSSLTEFQNRLKLNRDETINIKN